jgi:hypothetical protein
MKLKALILTALAMVALRSNPADAGCGCEKPPPPVATVRPNVAYVGASVVLFSPALQVGATYDVTFTSGIGAGSTTVPAVAVVRRDLADRIEKRQLIVTLPALPLGPTAIRVSAPNAATSLLSLSDAQFTVTSAPITMPSARGEWQADTMQAGVSRDGTVYLAFDLAGLAEPLIFNARALGYPLRFTNDDVIFYNSQGFLMQRLVAGSGTKPEPVPGMSVQPAADPNRDSDALNYSRHEFVSYFLQHGERAYHQVDTNDPNWHLDGTPHIDHNLLILAVRGRLQNGTLPVPGATPTFALRVSAYSIFYAGLVGVEKVEVKDTALVDSYDPYTLAFGNEGDVFSNRTVSVKDRATIQGNVDAASIVVDPAAQITGTRRLRESRTFMQVKQPPNLPSLGSIELKGKGRTIVGPGSFQVTKIKLDEGARLFVDNSAGPVTLYVAEDIVIEKGSTVAVADTTPEKFAVYATGDKPIKVVGNGSMFVGVVYAPRSEVTLSGDVAFYGALVGREMKAEKEARVHYDGTLGRD